MQQTTDRPPIRWTPRARRLGRYAEMTAVVIGTGLLLALVCIAALLSAPGGA